MVACMEDLPSQLLRAMFGLPGQIDQSPDFEEDFRTLSCAIMFLAGKCYLPALVWYHANMWVKMYFTRVAMTPQYIY